MSLDILGVWQWSCDFCHFELDYVIAKNPPPLPEGWVKASIGGFRTATEVFSCPSERCQDRLEQEKDYYGS